MQCWRLDDAAECVEQGKQCAEAAAADPETRSAALDALKALESHRAQVKALQLQEEEMMKSPRHNPWLRQPPFIEPSDPLPLVCKWFPSQGEEADFGYSMHFDPSFLTGLMYEGCLPMAYCIGPYGEEERYEAAKKKNAPIPDRRKVILLPKLHLKRCILRLGKEIDT
jgi:hypothetical protein